MLFRWYPMSAACQPFNFEVRTSPLKKRVVVVIFSCWSLTKNFVIKFSSISIDYWMMPKRPKPHRPVHLVCAVWPTRHVSHEIVWYEWSENLLTDGIITLRWNCTIKTIANVRCEPVSLVVSRDERIVQVFKGKREKINRWERKT